MSMDNGQPAALPATSQLLSSINRWERLYDLLFRCLLWGFGCLGFLLPAAIVGFLVVGGGSTLTWQFLSDFPKGVPLGSIGGIWPAIQGSFSLAVLGLCIATPLAFGGGIYLAEFGRHSRFSQIIRFAIECLVAVPSVIYGLFGYAFLVVFFKFGISLLAGGITLAMIMFPIMVIAVQESLQRVDDSYREAALALGVTTTYLVQRVLMPRAWPGIVAGMVLAVGHAVGSAAPVLFTASVFFSKGNPKYDEPVMTLPTHLYYLVSEGISQEQAFGTALVLVIGFLIFNLSALMLRKLGNFSWR